MKSEIEQAEPLFENGEYEAARSILTPLIRRGDGAAIRLDSCHFEPGISEEEMDRRYVEGMIRASECGDLEALYVVGSFYDSGEFERVPQDKTKASAIFKNTADRGHAHSMWIHATELLWGRGSYPQSIDEGLKCLERAIESGSAEACITKARLLISGELGLQKDKEQANRLRKRAKELDDTTFDPFD